MKNIKLKKAAAMSLSTMMLLSMMTGPVYAIDEDAANDEVIVEQEVNNTVEEQEVNEEVVEENEEVTEENEVTEEAEVQSVETEQTAIAYQEGVTVEKDENSPSDYTAHFVYNANNDTRLSIPEGYHVESVTLNGSFRLISGVDDYAGDHSLEEYKNGDFVANVHPYARTSGNGIVGYEWVFNMETTGNGYFTKDIPMISGAHYYYYTITYANDAGRTRSVSWDDPANPSPCRDNEANSNSDTGDITHSIVYGKWDSVKQSESPNLDYMTPYDGARGTVEYVEYKGTLANDQDLGVYLPPNYDPDRAEPYKVIYLSHGAGGNETYWFSQPMAGNVMDHVIAENPSQEAIIVCLDNALYNWNYYQIGQNVVNYVIPFIEANYNVSTNPEDRAFAGFSMGSMTTTYMAFHHADQFGYFGIFSGCNIGNATFKEGFEYDGSRLQNSQSAEDQTAYLQEVYANIEPSEDLLNSFIFTMAGNVDTAVYANGFARYGAYETIRDWAKANMPEGNFVDGGLVPGSHDIYTWGQCIYEFANVCWTKDTTDEPSVDEPTQPTTPVQPDTPADTEKPAVTTTSTATNSKTNSKVKTGDDTNMDVYAASAFMSLLMAGSAFILNKKRKAKN